MALVTQTALSSWLKEHNPSLVKVRTADGDQEEVKACNNRYKWAKLEEAILSLDPVEIRAYDRRGAFLAILKMESSDIEKVPDAKDEAGTDMQQQFAGIAREVRIGLIEAFDRGAQASGIAIEGLRGSNDAMVKGQLQFVSLFLAQSQKLGEQAAKDENGGGESNHLEKIMLLLTAGLGQQQQQQQQQQPAQAQKKANGGP